MLGHSQILSVQQLHDQLTFVELTRPPNYSFTYGQYAAITVGDGNSKYLAFASAPQDTTLKLLVAGDSTPWQVTDSVTLGEPQGGFTQALATAQRLLLITHGSGISAMLGLLKDKGDGILPQELICLWGVRSASYLTIPPHFGVAIEHITPIFSQEKGHLTGYVQDHLKNFYRPGMTVLLVGSKEMTAEVKNLLVSCGAAPQDIFFNF